MKIYSVFDKEFKPYGKVLEGYDTAELIDAMNKIGLPETGVAYEPSIQSLEVCSLFSEISDRAYGGMPVELGMCWGRNTKKAFRVPAGAYIGLTGVNIDIAE